MSKIDIEINDGVGACMSVVGGTGRAAVAWWWWGVVGVALLLLVVGANLLWLGQSGGATVLHIGARGDRHAIRGFFSPEQDSAGAQYRWTRAESQVELRGFVVADRSFLCLRIGWLPPGVDAPHAVVLSLDDMPWTVLGAENAPRQSCLLLPPQTLHDGTLRLGIETETTRVQPDRRDLGIRLEAVTVGWFGGGWVLPPWDVVLIQWILVLVVFLSSWRLMLPWYSHMGGAVVMTGFLVWSATAYPWVMLIWQRALLGAGIATLMTIWAAFPRLATLIPGEDESRRRQELQWLWMITIVSLLIRLVAILWPVFDSHDWYIHRDRLVKLQGGSMLLYDKPAEFGGNLAIVPPALYVMVTPMSLLTSNTVPIIQGFYAFLDGIAPLFLAILVRQMGGSTRAGIFAACALTLMPIQFTALWWGFGPQVAGQALLVVLAVLVAMREIRSWQMQAVVIVILSLILFMHIGTGLLGVFWLVGYVGLLWWYRAQQPMWRTWIGILFITGMIVTVFFYSDVIELHMRGLARSERDESSAAAYFRFFWTLGSVAVSFRPLVPSFDVELWNQGWLLPIILTLCSQALVLISLGFLLFRAQGAHRMLVATWVGSAALFFLVDLISGLQIRYGYFVIPMICAGLGWLLDRLMIRHRRAWIIGTSLLVFIGIVGLSLWFNGIVLGNKPSLRPLTH